MTNNLIVLKIKNGFSKRFLINESGLDSGFFKPNKWRNVLQRCLKMLDMNDR